MLHINWVHNCVVFYSSYWVIQQNIFHIGGLVLDYSNAIANALELLQSYTKPSICASLELGYVTARETSHYKDVVLPVSGSPC